MRETLPWVILLASIGAPTAQASPLINSRIGGPVLVGPTTPHLASTFYNPAVLGLLPGHNLLLQGGASLKSLTMTGAEATNGATDTSFNVAPDLLLAASSDLGLEAIVLGLLAHTLSWDTSSIRKADVGSPFISGELQSPNAYHGTHLDMRHVLLTVALALDLGASWYLGVSVSYAFGWVDFGFVRDTALEGGRTRGSGELIALDDCGGGAACGYGGSRAAEGLHIDGTSAGFGFAVGLVGRIHPRLRVGLGYQSAILGFDGGSLQAKGSAWVRRSEAAVDAATGAFGSAERDATGRGVISYQLPDILSAGLAWQLSERILLDFQLRWTFYRRHEQLGIRLGGRSFQREPIVPGQILHYRGFTDTIGGQLATEYRLGAHLKLQGGAMLLSSAVPASRLSSTAIDGFTIDAFAALAWTLGPITLRFGYGVSWMPEVDTQSSDFDAAEMVSCVDAFYNVELPACTNAAAGRGLASAAGSYRRWSHQLSTSLGVSWQ